MNVTDSRTTDILFPSMHASSPYFFSALLHVVQLNIMGLVAFPTHAVIKQLCDFDYNL